MADVLSTGQAAERLGCSVRSVHRMIRTGRIVPVAKLPGMSGAYLLARSDVEALLAPTTGDAA